MPNIKLKTNDDKVLEVDIEIAKYSKTIRTIVEDLDLVNDEEMVLIPNANANTMRKIIQWLTYHKDDLSSEEEEEEEEEHKGPVNISSWDAEFLRVDQETLYELITAANHLGIKRLMDVACQTVANMIKGKTPEEIRTLFNIENDLTAEEIERINEENRWCEDNDSYFR